MEVSTQFKVLDDMRHIQRENNVTMLYMCESGSRAWGFASPDSDYDVRFVYVRPIRRYLSLTDGRDTIECDHGKLMGDDFDASGWDIDKFLRLMRNSNPSAFEWMHSPIVYGEDYRWDRVKEVSERCLDPRSIAYHYIGMFKKHDERYLTGDFVTTKKYLYMVRAALAAKWATERLTMPPVSFSELCDGILEPDMRSVVDELVALKRENVESDRILRIERLEKWLLESIEQTMDAAHYMHKRGKLPWDELNDLFLMFLNL